MNDRDLNRHLITPPPLDGTPVDITLGSGGPTVGRATYRTTTGPDTPGDPTPPNPDTEPHPGTHPSTN